VRLREVEPGDLDVYIRMRCDPVMTAELGGPLPREGMEAKVAKDVADTASGLVHVLMILPDDAEVGTVAGTVALWSHPEGPETISEVGWMVLPEFQGRGLATAAVRVLLERAREEDRWGLVHAFPGVTNGPSNGICRRIGFTFVGEQDVVFADRTLRANHWQIDPAAGLRRP